MATFNLDLAPDNDQPPMRGDIVVTARTVYRVLDSRHVDSRVWDNRWHLHLEPVARNVTGTARDLAVHDAVDGDERVFHSERYQRGETPASFFGPG